MADEVKLTPHEYQELAADELYASDAVIWVAGLGAGKTFTALLAASDMIHKGIIDRVLVWGTKRIAQVTWPEEHEKFGGFGVELLSLAGYTPAQRNKLLSAGEPDILVVNYEMAGWLYEQGVRADERTLVIFDEISKLKGATGKRRKDVVKVCKDAGARWGLTATPKGNREIDLWGQIDMIEPRSLGTFEAWRARHFRALDRDGFSWRILPGCDEIVDEQYAAVSFTVDIPPQPEPILIPETIILPPHIMRSYREFERELIAEINGGEVVAFHESTAAIKCRQIASGGFYDDEGEWAPAHTAKLDALEEIIEAADEPVLVLYQFRPEIDMIRERFPEAQIGLLGGGITDRQARLTIEAWNAGELDILLGHPDSMGHGLNLQQGGRRLVWFTLPWSLEAFEQTNGRLARQGQEFQVYSHMLQARGTIETVVAAALREKRDAQDALFQTLNVINSST